jgi:hypothetical protein
MTQNTSRQKEDERGRGGIRLKRGMEGCRKPAEKRENKRGRIGIRAKRGKGGHRILAVKKKG